jgi:hypothetical protein
MEQGAIDDKMKVIWHQAEFKDSHPMTFPPAASGKALVRA